MRRQLLELIEKETAYRTRMMQLDEDMRPENIDRSLSGIGTTRTSDLRDVRRRQLDNERRGVESLLNQTSASRARLELDVKDADTLVAADLSDEAWLRSLAAFGELNARHPAESPATSASIAAIILFQRDP